MDSEATSTSARERSLFLDALERPPGGGRSIYLDEACGDEPGLRNRVEALLEAHDRANAAFLDPPIVDRDALAHAAEPPTVRQRDFPAGLANRADVKPGDTIDAYELVAKSGEGGFAVVYEAKQLEPVHRRVALKLLKPGMDSEQILTRFETERQALAMMNHPHIASVYDAGTTNRGRPYFVMEFVEGEPITTYCDRNRFSIRRRLTLFIQVCRALQHAHQKAVINRDLKPTNILVSMRDGDPVPVVIDFGISKALSKSHGEGPTSQGQFLGTPQYMSPEQAGLHDWDVDTRSDIYSLGIILYELITGTTPLDAQQLWKAGFAKMERMIREEEAPKPTSRLKSLGERAHTIARERDTDPAHLLRQVRGDLDWIVMRALEKEPTRRYETATALARDIERHLRLEPVEASPPSVSYLFQKFVRRNKTMVVAAVTVLTTLLAAVVVSAWHAIRAEKARAETAAAAAFLENTLRNPAPNHAGQGLTVAEMLDVAVGRLVADVNLAPANKAHLFDAVARSYAGLGLRAEAVDAFEAGFEISNDLYGEADARTLEVLDSLADAHRHAGNYEHAIELGESHLALNRKHLGDDDIATATAMENLADLYRAGGRYDDAVALMNRALDEWIRLRGETDESSLLARGILASIHKEAGRLGDAIDIEEDTVARMVESLPADDPKTLLHQDRLSHYYRLAGRLDEGLTLARECLAARLRVFGERHPATLRSMNTLGQLLQGKGQIDEAIATHAATLARREEIRGSEHPEVLESLKNLTDAYLQKGNPGKALEHAVKAQQLQSKLLGPDHFTTKTNINFLARALMANGRHDRAIELYREALRVRTAMFGEKNPGTLISMHSLATALRTDRQFDEALALGRKTLLLRTEVLGLQNPATLNSMTNLAITLEATGEFDEAVGLYREALTLREKYVPQNPGAILEALQSLHDALTKAGHDAEAEEIQRRIDGF